MIKTEKTTSILTKELEALTDTQLHALFTLARLNYLNKKEPKLVSEPWDTISQRCNES